MAVSDLSIFQMLREKMSWHKEQQRHLTHNVANSDTPGYRPTELAPFSEVMRGQFQSRVDITHPNHMTLSSSQSQNKSQDYNRYEIRPAGNAVNLEDEMIKVANNQVEYQAATTLYSKSLSLMRTALGRGG